MKTATATKVIEQITKAAHGHSNEVRMLRTVGGGQCVRQGDIYLRCDPGLSVDGLEETSDRQLAPGNTKGSRHIVDGNVRVYRRRGDVLTGPVIVANERFTVTHPEHSHVSLPSGTYACTYQRDYAQEERARVMD